MLSINLGGQVIYEKVWVDCAQYPGMESSVGRKLQVQTFFFHEVIRGLSRAKYPTFMYKIAKLQKHQRQTCENQQNMDKIGPSLRDDDAVQGKPKGS